MSVNGRERWSRCDMQWKTVPQTSGRDRKCSVADGRQPSDTDDAERNHHLASESARHRSSSDRYVGARPC